MEKIKDRITLGVVVGIAANLIKQGLSFLFKELGWSTITPDKKAGGIFLSRKKTKQPEGKILGIIADFCIACKLAILLVFLISSTGKDNHLLKGLSGSSTAWIVMYGFLSRIGGTGFSIIRPKDAITSLLTHAVFGLVASQLIVTLGDESLFQPKYQTLSNPSSEELFTY
ncbi:MAG: hypothetical protein ACOYVD_01685 [Bacillota bacterium]